MSKVFFIFKDNSEIRNVIQNHDNPPRIWKFLGLNIKKDNVDKVVDKLKSKKCRIRLQK